jgi:hypothetical protein
VPGLVLALVERYGRVRQLMLNNHAWDNRVRRLAVGVRVVRIGWFASVDPARAIATTEQGDLFDLLVVPPRTAEAAAHSAMARAADPTNTMRAPDILAAIPAAPAAAAFAGVADDPGSVWDNEGGHLAGRRARRPINSRHSAAVS